MTTKLDLQNKVKELQAQIDAMPDDKRKGRWKPERGEKYWAIDSCGEGFDCVSGSQRWSDLHHAIGNIFPTGEAAQRHVENLKTHYDLMDLADFEPDWGDRDEGKRYIFWDHREDKFYISYWVRVQTPNTVYFRSEKEALAAIEKVGEERVENYLRGV